MCIVLHFGYVRMHTGAYGCIWVCTDAYGCVRMHTGVYGCVRMHTGVYGSIRVCTDDSNSNSLLPIAYCLLIAFGLAWMHTASAGCILPRPDAFGLGWMHSAPAGPPRARPKNLQGREPKPIEDLWKSMKIGPVAASSTTVCFEIG